MTLYMMWTVSVETVQRHREVIHTHQSRKVA